MKISVCIPMYNESKIIADTAKTLHEYMTRTFGDDFEILFSDDGSKDGSADIVRSLELSNVRVIGYEKNRGKGCAVRTALLESQGDIALFTDADLAYGTEVIGRVVGEFEKNPDSDLVIGSRNISSDGYEGYTLIRKIASKLYIKVLCFAGGFKLSDSQCGCKAFRRAAVDKIVPLCIVDGFAFDFEAILWSQKFGMKVFEMPVKVINHRESKIRVLRDSIRMLRDLRKMRKRIKKASV